MLSCVIINPTEQVPDMLSLFVVISVLLCTSHTHGLKMSGTVAFAPIVFSSERYQQRSSASYSKYMTAPMTPRREFTGQKLTMNNKKYAEDGSRFRKAYKDNRALDREEEKTLGKMSFFGKTLLDVKKKMRKENGLRKISDEAWASACGLSVAKLYAYLELAQSSRNRLVAHNLRLVDFWTRRLLEHSPYSRDLSYYQFFVEGVLGLTEATLNYDGRGKFGTYAQVYVRHALYKGATSLRPASIVPHQKMMDGQRIFLAKMRLQEQLGREPSDSEIATELSMSKEFVTSTKKIARTSITYGMDLPGKDGDVSRSIFDTVFAIEKQMGESNHDVKQNVDNTVWRANVDSVLSCCLDSTEKRTLLIRYGLMDGKSKSVECTAELMALTGQSVREILRSAAVKLRQSDIARSILESMGGAGSDNSSPFALSVF